MSIKIHWGAPGAYKTSGAIKDDFIQAARAGRTIVTNVRGLNDADRIRLILKDVPDSFQLLHIPTHEHEDAAANRELMARWFHWVPKGAFILLDEAQDIWPKRWTQKDLNLFDYPGGVAKASADKRPASFNQAFEMHRHHGWDVVLTTPDISLIRTDIRATCEGAFKHDNQAMIGLKGWYMETFHLATNRGTSSKDKLSVNLFRRIPKHVFELYQSTTTGEIKDSIAGLSMFKNPRLLFFVGLLALCAVYLWHLGTPSILRKDSPNPTVAHVDVAKPQVDRQNLVVDTPARDTAPSAVNPRPVAPVSVAPVPALMPRPFQGYRFRISGRFTVDGVSIYYYELMDMQSEIHLQESDLIAMGFTVRHFDLCNAMIAYPDGYKMPVSCRKIIIRERHMYGNSVAESAKSSALSVAGATSHASASVGP